MLVVQHRHDEISRLEKKRRWVGSRVTGGPRAHYGVNSVRANRIGHRARNCEQRIEISRGHALEVYYDTAIGCRIDQRGYRTGRNTRCFRTSTKSANDLRVETAPVVRCNERHSAWCHHDVGAKTVRIDLQGQKTRGVERYPSGDDPGQGGPVLLD